MNKKKFKFSSNNSNEFIFSFISHRFKRFKTKSASHINILSDKNDKFFSSFNEFQFSMKNIDLCRNDLIIAGSNLKKLVRNQNQIENVIDKYVINIQFNNDYN